jgi:hypothetical protein
MAGIEFDREVFTSVTEAERKPAPNILGPILLVLALGLAGLVGYKVFTQVSDNRALNAANAEVEQLQLQLADAQKQLQDLQAHRKPVKTEPTSPVMQPPTVVAKVLAPRPGYKVAAASILPPQSRLAAPKTVPTPQPSLPPAVSAETAAMKTELNANHEAWQATTDRLADVVGVVGQQQNEITETRDAVNQLLSQTRRQALSFELQRGNSQMSVGPVSLQLKNVDWKGQRYSVCVYFEARCIELKDRVLNEVVVFVVSKNGNPMELVATKILRDQIVGYLQIPVEQRQAH